METISRDTQAQSTSTVDEREHRLRGIVQQMAGHQEQALAALYDMTAAQVYSLALKVCGDSALAEEVTSDVYWQVWQQAASYDVNRGKVLTWLLTICRSRSIDALRRLDKSQPHPHPNELAEEQGSAQNEPVNLLHAVEQKSAIYAALKTLSHEQQQMLSLAFFRGLTHQQIADYTGMPLGTVKTHIRNAQNALKAQITRASPQAEELT
jgi:RNA polymerase sigma-70 factor (ECF subfamily)